MSLITRGLNKIEIGNVSDDGTMGDTLATLGYTAEGTCKLVEADGTTTELMAEESDDPIEVITTAGKKTLSFSVMDPDADTLALVLGGTATTNGLTGKTTWVAPATKPSIEQSVKITTTKGFVFSFPRVSLVGKLNAEFTKKNVFMVDIVCTILKPTNTSIGSVIADYVV